MALAFIVVAGAGLMVRTYRELTSLDFGFKPDHVLTMQIALPEPKYPGSQSHRLLTGIAAPREWAARCCRTALSSIRPMDGVAFREFSIPGRSLSDPVPGPCKLSSGITKLFHNNRTPLRKAASSTNGRPGSPGCRAGQRELRPDLVPQ